MMHDKLLRVLKELQLRFYAFSPLNGPDMFDALLVLAQQAVELQVKLGLPKLLSCRKQAPAASLRVTYRNFVKDFSELLSIAVFDPLTGKGRKTFLPQFDEGSTRRIIEMICDYLGRCIRYVEGRKADEPACDHVTLLQCAGMVNRSKRQLERWKTNDADFPTPDVLGEDGCADEWRWSAIRPYLEKKSKRTLPEVFPAHVV